MDSRGCGRCLHYVRKITTFLVSHIGLVSLVVGYCIMGAFTFEALEKDYEMKKKKEMWHTRSRVTDDLWNITETMPVLHEDSWIGNATKLLRDFEIDLVNAMRKEGWDGNDDLDDVQWTFAGALFYSIIVITTIGYGHIAPKTPWGKVVTIFYAILGIPLMLLCLSNIGDAMAQSFKFLYWKVCCYMCARRPSRKASQQRGRRGRSIRRDRTLRGSSGVGPRGTPMKRSLRASSHSQRSADSAFGPETPGFSTSSSDPILSAQGRGTSARYFEDDGIDQSQRSSKRSTASEPMTTSSARRKDGKGLVPPVPPPSGGDAFSAPPSPHHNPYYRQHNVVTTEEERAETPVIPNRYALDKEDSMRQSKRSDPGPRVSRQGQGQGRGEGLPQGYPMLSQGYAPSPVPQLVRYSRSSGRLGRVRESEERGYYPYDDYEDYDDDYDDDYDEDNPVHRNVPIWLCVFLVIGYIFGGAFLFASWEKWKFLDSAYFCFITLTTIGFGDFVPAQNVKDDVEVSIALCSLYLLFGIALLAMSFNLVQEQVISSVKSVAKSLGIIKEDEDDEE